MTMEIIEHTDERALVTVPDAQAGTFALASLTDDEFKTRLQALKRGRDRIATIQRELMDRDVDYGTIPGTPKPTLLKPGAEKLCDIYGLRADFLPVRVVGDGATAPHLAYQTRCELHLGTLDGPVVAVGYGSANSWERKHRYRRAERACPACGMVGALLKSKRDPEWFCWTKKGGCGKTFKESDPRVVDQPLGDIENPDPWDLDTTLLKMAEKRAHVDATLRATAASGLFTQDIEDLRTPGADEPPPMPEPTIVEAVEQRRSRSSGGTTPQTTSRSRAAATPPAEAPAVEPPAATSFGFGESGPPIVDTTTGEVLDVPDSPEDLTGRLLAASDANASYTSPATVEQRVILKDMLRGLETPEVGAVLVTLWDVGQLSAIESRHALAIIDVGMTIGAERLREEWRALAARLEQQDMEE